MSQKEIDGCYSKEDDSEALDCLKKVIKSSSGACRPKLVLLTQGNCLPCSEEKERHAEDITQGTIQEINLDTPEGIAIARSNNIDFVPALLLLDCHNKFIEPSA